MGLASTLTRRGFETDEESVGADATGVDGGGKGEASHEGVAGFPAVSLRMVTWPPSFRHRLNHCLNHRG
jgi:hypothetical protein